MPNETKLTNKEMAAHIAGIKARESVLWKAKSEADSAWTAANNDTLAAILTAMRDNGAWIGCAFDGEEGMVEATLYMDGAEDVGISTSDVSEIADWLRCNEEPHGYQSLHWHPGSSPELLADLTAGDGEAE